MSPKYLRTFAGIALTVTGSSAFARGSTSLPEIPRQAEAAAAAAPKK
jgi:hypothetical protein